jgi:hypothetical protein
MYEMNSDEIKYERILNILRKSKPVLTSTDSIEEKVIEKIKQRQKKKEPSQGILDFLFGWVYIGWVRSGLIAASVLLVAGFIYQQAVMIRQINNLNRQTILIESQLITGSSGTPDAGFLYGLSGLKLPSGNITISNRQMKQILRSYNELEGKYKDLIKLIEENSVLKKYVEERLAENNKKKINL